MSVVSTKQTWKCACVLLCQETAIRSYHWGCFFLQRFILMLSPNTTTFDTNSTPSPANSMSQIFSFLFFSTHGNSRVHIATVGISASKDASSFPVSTSARDSSTGSMSSPMGATSRFRVFVGLTSALLCHPRFPTADCSSHDNARHRSH